MGPEAEQSYLAVGEDQDGTWFLWCPGKKVGKTADWTPARERILNLTDKQVRHLQCAGVRPLWSGK